MLLSEIESGTPKGKRVYLSKSKTWPASFVVLKKKLPEILGPLYDMLGNDDLDMRFSNRHGEYGGFSMQFRSGAFGDWFSLYRSPAGAYVVAEEVREAFQKAWQNKEERQEAFTQRQKLGYHT